MDCFSCFSCCPGPEYRPVSAYASPASPRLPCCEETVACALEDLLADGFTRTPPMHLVGVSGPARGKNVDVALGWCSAREWHLTPTLQHVEVASSASFSLFCSDGVYSLKTTNDEVPLWQAVGAAHRGCGAAMLEPDGELLLCGQHMRISIENENHTQVLSRSPHTNGANNSEADVEHSSLHVKAPGLDSIPERFSACSNADESGSPASPVRKAVGASIARIGSACRKKLRFASRVLVYGRRCAAAAQVEEAALKCMPIAQEDSEALSEEACSKRVLLRFVRAQDSSCDDSEGSQCLVLGSGDELIVSEYGTLGVRAASCTRPVLRPQRPLPATADTDKGLNGCVSLPAEASARGCQAHVPMNGLTCAASTSSPLPAEDLNEASVRSETGHWRAIGRVQRHGSRFWLVEEGRAWPCSCWQGAAAAAKDAIAAGEGAAGMSEAQLSSIEAVSRPVICIRVGTGDASKPIPTGCLFVLGDSSFRLERPSASRRRGEHWRRLAVELRASPNVGGWEPRMLLLPVWTELNLGVIGRYSSRRPPTLPLTDIKVRRRHAMLVLKHLRASDAMLPAANLVVQPCRGKACQLLLGRRDRSLREPLQLQAGDVFCVGHTQVRVAYLTQLQTLPDGKPSSTLGATPCAACHAAHLLLHDRRRRHRQRANKERRRQRRLLKGDSNSDDELTSSTSSGTDEDGPALEAPQMRVELIAGPYRGRVLDFGAEGCSFGRSAACAVPMPTDRTVSPLHARINHVDGRWFLSDCGSRSGTFLLLPDEGHGIDIGDVLRICSTEVVFLVQPVIGESESEWPQPLGMMH
uniref:FHA domain-containing protein n=1 Tax=Chrysotila carterae TaxID=13221 RepID=A0A7S4C055_CHRCT